MTVTWLTGLLLSFISYCTSQGDECVVGIIGESTILPCIYDGAEELASLNISIEWRRDTEVIHRTEWGEGHNETRAVSHSNRTTVSSMAPQTGDFSMELSDTDHTDSHIYSLYLNLSDHGTPSLLCTVCLVVAAHFHYPVLLREDGMAGNETRFICHTRGGFPEPAVHWLINHREQPPAEAVTTHSATLPDSELYNITSVLTANVSLNTSVSCSIESYLLNETLTATSYGVQLSTVVGRAAEAMWMFSTVLCVMVGVLVALALAYQIKWDRERTRHPQTCGEDTDSEDTEMIMVDVEELDLPETDV